MSVPDQEIFLPPLVSIGIPTFNREPLLREALDSLLRQDYKRIEIIISDNSSTDGTENFCQKLSASDSRIKYFRQSTNIGPTRNFEFVRQQAIGNYFMWLSDDDRLSTNFIGSCVAKLEKNFDAVSVGGVSKTLSGDGHFSGTGNVFEVKNNSPILRIIYYLAAVNDNSIFYGLYRREAIANCRFYNVLAGDWAWMCDVLIQGKALIEPSVIIMRRLDGISVSIGKILKTLGLPIVLSTFPFTTIATSIFHTFVFRSDVSKQKFKATRFPIGVAIFITIMLKGACIFIYRLVRFIRNRLISAFSAIQNLPRSTR